MDNKNDAKYRRVVSNIAAALRQAATRKIVVALVVSLVGAFGVAVEPELLDHVLTVASIVVEAL